MDENTTEQANPFANDSQPQQEPGTGDETGSQQPETSSDGAEVAVEAVQPTAESILSGLLSDLEGLAHMSKTEVEHIVQAARVAFQSL